MLVNILDNRNSARFVNLIKRPFSLDLIKLKMNLTFICIALNTLF